MKRMSSTTRYLVLVFAFLIVANASLGLILTSQSNRAIRLLMEERMLDVANSAAAMLDGDELKQLEAEDKNTPEYRYVFDTLRKFQQNIELEYIYCVRDAGNKSFVFMIDPEPVAPGQFGEPVAYTDALYQASQGTAAVDEEPYEDRWGKFYSAYTPVFDSKHQVAGIIAVDFSAEWYDNQIRNLARTIVIVIVISLFIGAVLVFLVASKYRKRFALLFEEVNGLSNGIEALICEVSPEAAKEMKVEDRQKAIETGTQDEIEAIGDRIRALEDRLGEQIALIRAQAYVDGLTGLQNRAAYEIYVAGLKNRIREGDIAFSLALFDINELKAINDDLGHKEGDRVIIAAANALKDAFCEGKVYRIGGDEFVVLFEDEAAAARFEAFDRLNISRNGSEAGSPIALSGGCAVFDQERDRDYNEVFIRADKAMYDDKRLYYQSQRDRRRN